MKKLMPILVFNVTAIFYYILAAKHWTWIFASSDSGDWLAASQMWMVPQPVGSPLYVLLGHLLNSIPSGSLVLKMTLILSCLASAVTVMFVYMIISRLTKSSLIGIACSVLLTSSAVFLSQSTVLEEYSLVIMFMTIAFWFYVTDHKNLVGLFIGLAIAVHAFALIFGLLWLAILYKEWKKWILPSVITTSITIVFYSFILILMYMDTPRLIAGGLTFNSLKMYLFDISGGIIGTMSIFEAPYRFFSVGRILLVSFSLALIPIIRPLRPLTMTKLLLLSNVAFVLWYVLTTVDPITWTYIALISPSIAILCGIGLVNYRKQFTYAILATSVVLMGVNSFYLNADRLTHLDPKAQQYYNELMILPNGSMVVTTPGAYSLGLFYVISQGKDLIPVVYPYTDKWHFEDYARWLSTTYNIAVNVNTLDTILDNPGIRKYYAQRPDSTDELKSHLNLAGNENSFVREIVGVLNR